MKINYLSLLIATDLQLVTNFRFFKKSNRFKDNSTANSILTKLLKN